MYYQKMLTCYKCGIDFLPPDDPVGNFYSTCLDDEYYCPVCRCVECGCERIVREEQEKTNVNNEK